MEGTPPREHRPGAGDRLLNAAVWCAVIAAILAIAFGVARYLSTVRLEFREIAPIEKVDEMRPVAPPREPAAPTIGPDGEVVRMPTWVRQPITDYPEQAFRRGVNSGSVKLRCSVLPSGRIVGCDVVEEQPAGVGFAEAALKGVRHARVTPRTVDGVATNGTIQFTVRFRMD